MIEFLKSQPPEQLVLIMGVVAVVVSAFMYTGNSRRVKPSRLNLGSGGGSGRSVSPRQDSEASVYDEDKIEPDRSGRAKMLNVVFNYNQHTFDAYEILGLPAGASFQMVEKAYLDMKANTNDSRLPLIEAAYHAIRVQTQAKN